MTPLPADGGAAMWREVASHRLGWRLVVWACLFATRILLATTRRMYEVGLVKPAIMRRALRFSSGLTQLGLYAWQRSVRLESGRH